MSKLMRFVASCGLAVASLLGGAKGALAQDWYTGSLPTSAGFQTLEFDARYASGVTGAMRVDGTIAVGITPHHHIQGDLGVVIYNWSWWGVIGAHLSMTQGSRVKYGLFASISDANDASYFEFNAGAELGWAPTDRTYVQARVGMGWVIPGSNDYLFAELDGVFAITDNLRATARVAFVNFEEANARANQFTYGGGFEYDIGRTPITAYGGVERTFSIGASDLHDETRFVAGVKLRLGRQQGTSVNARPWTPIRPFEGHMSQGNVLMTF